MGRRRNYIRFGTKSRKRNNVNTDSLFTFLWKLIILPFTLLAIIGRIIKPLASKLLSTEGLIKRKQKNKKEDYSYRKKYLLTKNEYIFFKTLKPIADELNLIVLTKIRMADLLTPAYHYKSKEYYGAFQKIKAKHVDFALALPNNCAVVLLIELDDNSHDTEDRRERDEFCDTIYANCGYSLLHVRSTRYLKEQIVELLGKNIPEATESAEENDKEI